jgi:exodeoxyribonuclease V alpha subunit
VALNRQLAEAFLGRQGADGWVEGRPVMVTRNEPALGVFNGDVGLVLRPPDGGAMRVWFADGGPLRSVAAARLAAVETAFAMTVHKSQGSEFGHVALVLPGEDSPVLTREWVYTGITRARLRLTLAGPQPALLARALARRTRRFSGLGEALRQGAG